jgi:hypothetical protein
MATRIETLGGGKRAPKAAWIMLFAVVMVAAALAIGALVWPTARPRSRRVAPTSARSPRWSRRRASPVW